MTRNELFPELPARGRTAVPRKLIRKLAPSNPKAKVPYHAAIQLMLARQLGTIIRDQKLANIRANSTWLFAFEMLEDRGLHKGLHVSELAEAKGITLSAAKRQMLRAETMVYDLFGINISFIDRDGMWRLATEQEVALKYAQMLRSIKSVSERVRMYQGAAAKLGEREGRVALPLFKINPED